MSSAPEVVLGVFSAIEQRDRDAFLALCHDDVEMYEAPSLPYGSGKEAFAEAPATTPGRIWLGTWGPGAADRARATLGSESGGDCGKEVTVIYRQRALSPGAERFDSPVLGLYEVRAGKLARAQTFHFDTAAILAFLDRAGAKAGPRRGSRSERRPAHDADV